ncbi:hypothetical protein QCA50_011391 [Cerrena zonata]|uniref:Uncharacterized protein n=1 Tax=Cerrena zonata TaxID=2478898 RepID=A0AAW0G938_9APHY
MAADTQSSSPFSRLPRLGFNFGFKSGPSSPLRETYTSPRKSEKAKEQEKDEDWYIPYNGPIESPRPRAESNQDRESWGDLLNGWLTEDPSGSPQNGRSTSRTRALSTVTHLTSSSGNIDPSRKSVRMSSRPRVAVPSFINLDQAGGIGDVPMPAERSSKYESTIATSPQTAGTSGTNANRSSLASIWSFGKRGLRHSASLDQLSRSRSSASGTRERANTSAYAVPAMPTASPVPMSSQRGNDDATNSRPAPIAEDNEYYYSSLLVHQSISGHPQPRQEDLSSHPYAVAFPTSPQSQSAPPPSYKGKSKALNPGKLTITWLDPRQKSIPGYLKPSPRNSILKASLSTPNLRDLPKGKQRWLSAETWCDAIILPRPRFALRLAEGQPSGRIVSPPGSPVSSPEESQGQDSRNRFAKDSSSTPLLKQSVSLNNLVSPTLASTAPPSRALEKATPASAGPVINETAKTLKPPRPKSWALDDLALPSPVPSLAQVLAEGEQLDKEREMWRAKATHSFQNKRARTFSRARSKSIGASQARRNAREAGEITRETTSPLEYLAERTLLGAQTVPPKIHIHAPPVPKSPHTTSASRTAISSVFSTHSQNLSRVTSRTKSHGHSNSLGGSVTKSQTDHSSSGHSNGHVRSQSLGKSAFRMVKNTATNAAVLCGLNEKSPMLSPMDEKAFAMEGALRGNDTKVIRLQDQARNDAFREREDVVVLSPIAASRESPNRLNGVSPTPSGFSVSAEGVGIAISSPLPSDDHSHEPIHIPAHPYAQGTSSYPYRQPIKVATSNNPGPAAGDVYSPTGPNPHRQAVLVHPYAQASHPYASPGAQYIDAPTRPAESLFAELTPGHVREFDPDSIRYSPYMHSSSGHGHGQETEPNSPQDYATTTPKAVPATLTSDHPYVRNNASRYSELVFGDALVRTMRHSASVDSGFGPSEIDDHNQATDSKGDSGDEDMERPTPRRSNTGPTYLTPGQRPSIFRAASGSSSNALTSSSSENVNPPVFRRPDISGLANSSGSSPGMISHDSSPPLSPRVINDSDDLDRFRDLFYKPSSKHDDGFTERSRRPSQGSRKTSGSITFEVGSHSSRSLSGLTNLARQLSEDLEELREEEARRDQDDASSAWGSRFGSIRGARPDDMSDDPKSLLSQHTSSSDSPAGTNLPLRLPNDATFASPTANYPEDIQPEEIESSRASSILDGSALSHENPANFRIGEVEAVSTPPVESSAQRFSQRLSVVADEENQRNSHIPSTRVASSQYGLSPLTPDAARSSYMTSDTGSRMSGLSDFPAPPTLTSHMSIGPYITRSEDNTLTTFDDSQHTTTMTLPPPLLREPSQDTFGIRLRSRDNVGEAL